MSALASIPGQIGALLSSVAAIGSVLQIVLLVVAAGLFLVAALPGSRRWSGVALVIATLVLIAGELVLIWFHWRLYQLTPVVNPATSATTGHMAVPLWIESEKLYVWALVTATLSLFVRRQRAQLMPGLAVTVALFTVGAVLVGRPFTEPLPSFLGQYGGYLQGMLSGAPEAAQNAYAGMEGSRQFFYNTWYMWIHPPLLFFSYGCFTISFIATLGVIRHRRASWETTAYQWARLGYLTLTLGMLLGLPWALSAWQGEAWWWSGKINMSMMMWLLYTAYLHGRLYLRRRGMWRWVVALSVLSFSVLVLTYITTYVVPGAHSYAAAFVRGGVA